MQKIDGLFHATGRNASVHQQATVSGRSAGHSVSTSVQSNGAHRRQIAELDVDLPGTGEITWILTMQTNADHRSVNESIYFTGTYFDKKDDRPPPDCIRRASVRAHPSTFEF